MTLKKQTFRGLKWNMLDVFMLRGITFISSIILARILGPKEFGLVGMISIFIAIGLSLVDSGMSSSIIRTKVTNNTDYSTVFYMNLSISFLLFLIFFFIAPYIALFYEQDVLVNVIRLYCLSFIVSAFSAIQLAILNKQMLFKKIMIMNIPGVIIGSGIGILLGYLGYGVWSIVWMYLSIQMIQSIMLWLFSNWKPTLNFSTEKMKFHFHFGYKLMLSGLLDTFFNNIYNVIIGKYFTVQSLGFYERSKSLNDQPVMLITSVINNVSYPLLSQIQDNREKISLVYNQILQFSFFIITPLMFGAIAIAKPLFNVLLGAQWLPAVPFFQILCLGGIFYPIHAFNINILKVYGRSDLFLKLEIIKKIIIVLSISFAFQFGIYGLLWSHVFTSVVALIINTHYSSKMIDYKTTDQLLDMVPTLFIASLTLLIMTWVVSVLGLQSHYIQITVACFIGWAFYFILNYLLKSRPMFFAISLIRNRKND